MAMEYGNLEREIRIDASPEVVFDVISSPEHLKEWWPDEADLDPSPGGTGEIVFGDRTSPEANVVQVTVVEAEPPRLFSFRWTHPKGDAPTPSNSLLVTFRLEPSGTGTILRLTETGFREQGWEVAVLEEQYQEHSTGWDYFLPRLVKYAERLVSKS